jgi:hypothetical protein
LLNDLLAAPATRQYLRRRTSLPGAAVPVVPRFIALSLMCLSVAAARAGCQSAVLSGAVVRDTLSHGISGALIAIPALKRSDTSDAAGEFKLSGLPSGRFAVLIRRIGFKPMVDTVVLITGSAVEREYVMDAAVAELDSVRVNARRTTAPGIKLIQFEERRKKGSGGFFVTDSVLRVNETRRLTDVLTSLIPGIKLYHPFPGTRPTMEYVTSGRGTCVGPVFQCVSPNCPVTLFLDGVKYFSATDPGDAMPDLSGFEISNYAAVEYYPGGASIPLQFNMTGSGCGVLLLWTRERR